MNDLEQLRIKKRDAILRYVSDQKLTDDDTDGEQWLSSFPAEHAAELEALRAAIAERDAAETALRDAREALEAERARVERERTAAKERAYQARIEAGRNVYEAGASREPGKGILVWPFGTNPSALGVWVATVSVVREEHGAHLAIGLADDSRVRYDLVEALGLKEPTRADISRYLRMDMLDATVIEKVGEDSSDPPIWYVYDPGRWERRAGETVASDDEPQTSAGGPVVEARATGAMTTSEYAAAMGVSRPTARKALRAAGAVEDTSGKAAVWRFPDAETGTPSETDVSDASDPSEAG